MNIRAASAVAAFALACGGTSPSPEEPRIGADIVNVTAPPAVVERPLPAQQYEAALAEVMMEIARVDQAVATLDAATGEEAGIERAALLGDRVAAQSFAADLGACIEHGQRCPRSLTAPTLPAGLAADQLPAHAEDLAPSPASWPDRARQLGADACACRTALCAQWVLIEIETWEKALPAADQDNETAQPITDARQCIWRRLGH